jgi:hypothetical protein
MALPESQSRVLEDGTEALLEAAEQDGVEADVNENSVEVDEEFVDLSAPTEVEKPAPATKPAAKPVAKPVAAAVEDEIPADLKGKTPAQMAKMIRDAQQLIGRQGSELGDYRKKVDTLILASLGQIQARKAAEPEVKPAVEAEMDESEIFAKPKEAISKLIQNHPELVAIRKALGSAAADTKAQRTAVAAERFNAAHPDAQEILQDAEFRQWVGASRVRKALLQRAHQAYDFEAGDEVFSTWKALKGVTKKSEATAEAAAEETPTGAPTEAQVKSAAQVLARQRTAKAQAAAAQAAAAPTGGASVGKPSGSKKVYRRADVLRLMEEDPDRYELLSDELTKAYAEGRVR